MNLLEMKNIKKEFNGQSVLKDISLQVKEGEIVSIIGPSGSGKSTLLRCATMLTDIDSGEISYMGKRSVWMENGKTVVPSGKQLKEIRSCFGLVFQNFNLFPHYSVIKNITDAPIHVQKRKKEEVYFLQRWDFLTKKTPIPVSFPEVSVSVWLLPGLLR